MKAFKIVLALAFVFSFTWSSFSEVKATSDLIVSQQDNLKELEELIGEDVVMEVMSGYGHKILPPLPSFLPLNDIVFTTPCQQAYQYI